MATCNLCGKDAGYLSFLCDDCRATRAPVGVAKESTKSSSEVPNIDASDRDDGNFFTQLINGDFGLARTYWLFGVLVGIVVGLVSKTISSVAASVWLTIAYTAYEIVVLIGTWRAANRYQGPRVWATLAKIAVIFGIVMLVAGVLVVISLFGRP